VLNKIDNASTPNQSESSFSIMLRHTVLSQYFTYVLIMYNLCVLVQACFVHCHDLSTDSQWTDALFLVKVALWQQCSISNSVACKNVAIALTVPQFLHDKNVCVNLHCGFPKPVDEKRIIKSSKCQINHFR